MIDRFRGKNNLIKLSLLSAVFIGLYLIVAWASYSPLDNAWTVSSTATAEVLNKTGKIGAWIIDVLFALFGNVAFLIPFGLTFTAAYVLILRYYNDLRWSDIGLWGLSFVGLISGLAGFSSVILPNTVYHLSGGVVGALFHQLMGTTSIGQFGVLFTSLIFVTLGFYYCSGQVVLQLFNRLYQWILEGKESSVHDVQNTQQANETDELNAQEIELDEPSELVEGAETNVTTSGFTDVSSFSRPNITGLKVTPVETAPVELPVQPQNVANNLTDISMFKVETQTDLPHVSVLVDRSIEAMEPVASVENAIETVKPEAITMPKVRLNPAEELPSQSTELQIPEVVVEQPLEREQGIIEQNVEEQSKLVEPAFIHNMTPNVRLDEKTTESVNLEEHHTKQNTYPKGYGESLVHPLLATKKKLEKPTTALPTLDLLTSEPPSSQQITEQQILATSERIEQELANFGVKATVEDVLVGPVVTRYEIRPAAGVKASKISGLGSDLARALIFKAIRITDVVPGKPYMGIETPNPHRETVWLRDVFNSDIFRHSKATLPMALGKGISGDPVVIDMAKTPHLLVAGQTGGGKSVGVNTMILSLLYKLTPDEVRFIMIDPKVVELSIYNDIPHLLTPVVTDMKKAENALRWAVEEMERRYVLVSKLAVRNIEGYNAKIDQAEEMAMPIPDPTWRPGDSMDQLPPHLKKLPYIVLIVDEFADLMMSAGKQVEDYIMRIAQKARAVGIHLILATQRPSTDVITGVIKANIPSRIAFTVASQIDSRTILDSGGAESLLGRGDMLYSGAGSPEILRVHGAFMTDEDVQRVADNWRARGKPDYIDSIVASAEDNDSGERSVGGDVDPLFDEIAQFMIDGGATSISGIQRRFSLGFNRAARIIDQLEEQGILSAPDNRGKREVLAR
ncbi:cell division protein FtsK [Pasteurellaceae bacterium 15-036681]|nr:cell division protein FtsK [Pasteurellaceae bacterium 15-036681]